MPNEPVNNSNKLKPCPFCGREVEIQGGPENWHPTLLDPDSGGDPYYIACECGCNFGLYEEASEITEAWNRRAEK